VSAPLPQRWRPDRTPRATAWPRPNLGIAILRGAANHCPACGKTTIFAGFLTVKSTCAACGAPLGEFRADDAPPYFTILLVGHIVVPLMLLTEKSFAPSQWLLTAIFVPLSLVLAVGLLRPVKGATVGLMLRLGMMKDPMDD
jgi:uncharacterized protein (DUF983 family)